MLPPVSVICSVVYVCFTSLKSVTIHVSRSMFLFGQVPCHSLPPNVDSMHSTHKCFWRTSSTIDSSHHLLWFLDDPSWCYVPGIPFFLKVYRFPPVRHVSSGHSVRIGSTISYNLLRFLEIRLSSSTEIVKLVSLSYWAEHNCFYSDRRPPLAYDSCVTFVFADYPSGVSVRPL